MAPVLWVLNLKSSWHLTSAPASNGLAEIAVQIVKKGLKKQLMDQCELDVTPQTTTALSPSEMLLGRRPRSRLDVLKPHTADRVERKQWSQKAKHNYHARSREFKESDCVFVRNYHAGAKWLPGIIVEKAGPVSYKVELTNGQEQRCHQGSSTNKICGTTGHYWTNGVSRTNSWEWPRTNLNGAGHHAMDVTPSGTPSIPIEPKIYPRTTVTRYEPTWWTKGKRNVVTWIDT